MGLPGLEEGWSQVGMANSGTAPLWEEQQGPRLGARVSRGVALSLPHRLPGQLWREALLEAGWQAPQLVASAGPREQSQMFKL